MTLPSTEPLPKYMSRCSNRNTLWEEHAGIPKKSLMYWKDCYRIWGGLAVYEIIDGLMVLRDNQELLDLLEAEGKGSNVSYDCTV